MKNGTENLKTYFTYILALKNCETLEMGWA